MYGQLQLLRCAERARETHLKAMHPLDLLSEQSVDEAVLLHGSKPLEGRMRYGDGVERSATAWRSSESAELSLLATGKGSPETSCTSTLAPSSSFSSLSLSCFSPSVRKAGAASAAWRRREVGAMGAARVVVKERRGRGAAECEIGRPRAVRSEEAKNDIAATKQEQPTSAGRSRRLQIGEVANACCLALILSLVFAFRFPNRLPGYIVEDMAFQQLRPLLASTSRLVSSPSSCASLLANSSRLAGCTCSATRIPIRSFTSAIRQQSSAAPSSSAAGKSRFASPGAGAASVFSRIPNVSPFLQSSFKQRTVGDQQMRTHFRITNLRVT